MKPLSNAVKHALTLLVLLMTALIARLRIVLLDFNSLLTGYLPDDTFYYYKIAANISALHRITYDGEGLSNGYHPLWLALITPFYTSANAGSDFVSRVEWIMLALHLMIVVVLYLTLLRLRLGWWRATLVTAIFAVHSTFIDMQMSGLETSLNSLVLLLLFNAFLTVFLQPAIALRRYVFFGAMAGAAFLARTDNAIALLLLFTVLAWQSRRQYRQHWPRIVLAGCVSLLVASPWLLWNQQHFGSMIQSSGRIETILWGEPKFSAAATAFAVLLTPLRLHDHLQDFSRLFISPQGNPFVPAALLIAVFAVLWWQWLRPRNVNASLRALAWFSMAVLLVFTFHAGIRSFVRTWYHIPVGLLLLLTLAGFAAWTDSLRSSRWAMVSSGVLVIWLASVLWWYSPAKLPGVATERSPHFVVRDWIAANTPPDAVFGSMNSGILSYLLPRKVINLDGVVDQRSMQAHWQKRQPAYIKERGIRYLVDNDGALALFCAENPLYRCETVFQFGDSHKPSKVVQIVDKQVIDKQVIDKQ